MTYEKDYTISEELMEQIYEQGRNSQVRNLTVPEYELFGS
jgi:hypothetical protein